MTYKKIIKLEIKPVHKLELDIRPVSPIELEMKQVKVVVEDLDFAIFDCGTSTKNIDLDSGILLHG